MSPQGTTRRPASHPTGAVDDRLSGEGAVRTDGLPEPAGGTNRDATSEQGRAVEGAPEPSARSSETFEPPRIAVYREPHAPPLVVSIWDHPLTADHLPEVTETLAARAHQLAREQGGRVPLSVFKELVENLVHAAFAGVIITILDGGNTIRVSDRGPGIADKEAALRPGFTSADAQAKKLIRGVGAGLSMVQQTLAALDGALRIDDNLGCGTVITARVEPGPATPLAPAALPAYNLSERQLKTLLLAVELAPVGPTRVAKELGVATSTAYRDLVSLEAAGFVASGPNGHRSATDAGLAYLDAVL